MKPAWQRMTATCGAAGTAVIAAGIVLAGIEYHGRQDQRFSPLNHFISELGEVGVSQRAALFNTSLVLGGLLMAAFMVGLGFYLRSKLGGFAAAAGVVGALACSAVGLTPMNRLVPHLEVAGWFFRGGLTAIVLLTILVVVDRRRLLPLGLVAPGVVAVASFALLLAMPTIQGKTLLELLAPQFGPGRPQVWPLAIVEWVMLASVVTWIVWAAVAVWTERQRDNEKLRQ